MVGTQHRMNTETRDGSDDRPLRSYGRRKGKRLTARKAGLVADLLPRLRPDLSRPAPGDVRALFDSPLRGVWLEIGFGGGEHLLWQARANPDIGMIGCEPFLNGVASLLGGIDDSGIETIRIHDGDARDLIAWLPEASVSRAFILFPDPWPKKRQAKRRLVTPALVRSLARIISAGGELRFASDDMNYAREVLFTIGRDGNFAWTARRASDWRERPADWPETRYERKALSDGRKPSYLCFRRR
ncbi:tRNA (guanine(46)-N(7))-methyltransferase TrmB [Methyloceanibacter caenitepidi]|uniref:tRNA (guanine-N(7)-)-methyltransferase n=1 Tax=Methyloceanibacter caenitepidi TaxID=1384459 RepID=A0A0A8K0Z2_9HYPH|nr:tRNA (guanine(46)-N(7))-methyltransferase TrmB [Methyloceanibacter caenitepidi]BAQ16172.1 tRNA (guanine46-N7-)-methyltransferase [Methyloceanibacter caenitepidi]